MKVHEGTHSTRSVSQAARDTRQRVLRNMAILFLAAGFVAALTLTAQGQAPKYERIDLNPAFEKPQNIKMMKDAAKRISVIQDRESFNQTRAAELFFTTYVPAKMTHAEALSEIGPLVNEVVSRLSAAQRSQAPFTNDIMQWMYRGLKPVALGKYHPAARIAAISVLSRIDVEPARIRDGVPPRPAPYILTDFLPVYEDQNNVDGVRAAALQAVHRYVIYAAPSVRGGNLTKIKSLMDDLLAQEPPAGRSPKAHAFLQRYAVDILAALRGQSDPALGQKLISISTEVKKPDLIALHSAARIGEMSNDLKGKVTAPDDVLQKWAVRAMRAFQYEVVRLKAIDRPKAAASQPIKPRSIVRPKDSPEKPGGGGGGESTEDSSYEATDMMEGYEDSSGEDTDYAGYGAEMGSTYGMTGAAKTKPQPPEIFASRRKLNYVLQQLHVGATGQAKAGLPDTPGGLLGGVADAQQDVVKNWVNAMGEVLTALNDETLHERDDYIAALEAQVEMLKGIAGPAADEAAAIELKVTGVPPVVVAATVSTAAAAEADDSATASATPAADPAAGADDAKVDAQAAPQLPAEDELSFD